MPCIRCRRRTRTATRTTAPSTNTTVRFEKGQLPPAEAFWSLTMYDDDFFFVPNPIRRYDLAQRDKLVANPDGSVDMYLQANLARQGQGGELASRAEGQVQAGDAHLLAHRRRRPRSSTVPGRRRR